MNAAMVVTIGKTVVKYGQIGIKYLKDDYSHWTSLDEPVTIEVFSKGIGRFNYDDGSLSIKSPSADHVILHSEAFPADSHEWNLASIILDAHEKGGSDDGRDEGSLFHDRINTHKAEIAKANNTTKKAVSDWSDIILAIVWRSYGEKKGKGGWWLNTKVKAALNVCGSRLRSVWSKAFCVIVISLACLFLSGCDEVPEGHSTTPVIHYTTVTNSVQGVR